jgi:hypothetical protein
MSLRDIFGFDKHDDKSSECAKAEVFIIVAARRSFIITTGRDVYRRCLEIQSFARDFEEIELRYQHSIPRSIDCCSFARTDPGCRPNQNYGGRWPR